jgi:hypothetical protein
MLPTLVAVAAGIAPGERDYRLTVRAAPHASVTLRALIPAGWVAAFCTSSVCAPGHVVLRVPQSGTSAIALHVYRIEDRSSRHGSVFIKDDRGRSLTLPIAF